MLAGSTIPLSLLCLRGAVLAQGTVPPTVQFTTGQVEVRRWVENGSWRAAWSRDGGSSWQKLRAPDDRLQFRIASFDPLVAEPVWPGPLAAPNGTRLRLVQFHSQVLGPYRDAVTAAGAEILHFLPGNALFVRCDDAIVTGLRALPCVRWVGDLANA